MGTFISHSHKDKSFVEWLAKSLVNAGVDVWYDNWEIKVGDSILEKVNDGLSQSDFLIVVLSGSSIKSRWVREELNAASAEMIENAGIRILPVIIDDVEPPPLLRHRKYADFRKDKNQAVRELLDVLLPSVEKHWQELDSIRMEFNRLIKKAKKANVDEKLSILIEINSYLEKGVDLRYKIETQNRGDLSPTALAFIDKHEYLLSAGFGLRSSNWVRLQELRNFISHHDYSQEESLERRVKRVVAGLDELGRMMNRLSSRTYP